MLIPAGGGPPPITISESRSFTTAGQTLELPCDGYGSVAFTITGTWNGAFRFDSSQDDGVTWTQNRQVYQSSFKSFVLDANQNDYYAGDANNSNRVRVRCQFMASGTAFITIRAALSKGLVAIENAVQIGGPQVGSVALVYTPADGSPLTNSLQVISIPMLYNPVTNSIQMVRTVNAFKTAAAAAAGNTALWTPAAGKKFRLMRYMLIITDNVAQAAGGVLTFSLLDAAAGIGQVHDIFVPAAALVNSGSLYTSPWIDLGNGILSAVANNVLNINLSAALTAGNARVIACGTEE